MNISWRAVGVGDENFLRGLYASTREDEMRTMGLPVEMEEVFLRQQFAAQAESHRRQFPGRSRRIVAVDGIPAGKLDLDWASVITIVDIALLPEFRGKGIGSALLAEVLRDAGEENLPVRLCVQHGNPARRLYERLGFAAVAEEAVHVRMEMAAVGGKDCFARGGASKIHSVSDNAKAVWGHTALQRR